MAEHYLDDFAVGQTFRLRAARGRGSANQDLCRRIRSAALSSRRARPRAGACSEDLPPAAGTPPRLPCAYWSKATSSRSAVSLAPDSTSSAGRVRYGPGMSCASRVKCSRCDHRNRDRSRNDQSPHHDAQSEGRTGADLCRQSRGATPPGIASCARHSQQRPASPAQESATRRRM